MALLKTLLNSLSAVLYITSNDGAINLELGHLSLVLWRIRLRLLVENWQLGESICDIEVRDFGSIGLSKNTASRDCVASAPLDLQVLILVVGVKNETDVRDFALDEEWLLNRLPGKSLQEFSHPSFSVSIFIIPII